MKAIFCTKYGSPVNLQLKEVEKPIPKDDEIRIKVRVTTVTAGDVRVRRFDVPILFWIPTRLVLGIRRPKQPVLGIEYAGVVESVGAKVTKFKVGDRVFGSSSEMKFGCYSEYIAQPEDGIISTIPDNIEFEQVASIPFMGIGALYFIRKANIKKGDKILIYGASGAVGTYAVQLAKYFGAEVTAVCSTRNLELVKSLGADQVIDYTNQSLSDIECDFDIFFDAVGKCQYSKAMKSLKRDGVYITVDRGLIDTLRGTWTKLVSRKKIIAGIANPQDDDLDFLKTLVKKGELRSVIDQTFPFEQIAIAHSYVDQGHKKGNVIVTL